ncbi:MAG: hypothetical protein ABSF34_02905 [Verrucomicrobiota bacterium]|jgi:hypothetical protein
MPGKSGVISLLQEAVQQLHKCEAIHVKTVFVREQFQGHTLWEGDVEVFEVKGHAKARRSYAWLQHLGGKGVRYVALLEHGLVTSPQTAVSASIALDIAKPLNSDLFTGFQTD